MKPTLHILHLEDDENDAALIQHTLEAGGLRCSKIRVQSQAEFVAALEQGGFDLVMADYALPDFDGMTALKIVRNTSAELPFILISGALGEERAIEALTSGATDYVLKSRLSRLVPAVSRALREVEHQAERRKALEIQKEYSGKLQVLSRRLVETQEAERRHLARELHDEIGQTLTMAQINLQVILREPGLEFAQARLRESLTAIERVLQQVHDISLNLRPSILDDLGLEPALRWYSNRQAALVGLQTTFLAPPLAQRLDSQLETECFRIAQEALTNVVRHARAKAVTVELRQEAGQLHLRVRDDGIGFQVAERRGRSVRGESLGLLSMEERAVLAGGGLELTSLSPQGTEVHAWFPIKWQNVIPYQSHAQ